MVTVSAFVLLVACISLRHAAATSGVLFDQATATSVDSSGRGRGELEFGPLRATLADGSHWRSGGGHSDSQAPLLALLSPSP